jgi:hypothetical protein
MMVLFASSPAQGCHDETRPLWAGSFYHLPYHAPAATAALQKRSL